MRSRTLLAAAITASITMAATAAAAAKTPGPIAVKQFPWPAVFGDGTPGFRINIEEAIQLNQQALGPELIVNGDGSSLAGWTQGNTGASFWSASGGRFVATTNGTDNARLRQVIPTLPGRSYVVSYAATGGGSYSIGTVAGGSELLGFGTGVRIFSATTTEAHFNYITPNNGTTLDNVSVREIDLSKCVAFQDSAGTLPVTAMEQPLGLILDTKLGVPARGAELFNGNHQTGWSVGSGITLSAGKLTFTSTPTTESAIVPLLTINKWYDITFRVQNYSSGQIRVITSSGQVSGGFAANGTYTVKMQCTGAAGNVGFGPVTAAFTGEVVLLSVKELLGNHFVQPSNAPSRPIVSRRVNRATNTGFTLGAVGTVPTDWIERGSVTGRVIEDATAPSGRAMRVTVSAGGGFAATSDVRVTATELVPAAYKIMILAKRVSGGAEMLAQGAAGPSATLTLTGQYTWYEATMTATGSSHSLFFGGASAITYDIAAVDVRLSSDVPGLPSYQRVTSSTDYDEVGFPAYARADGLDDWLESGVVDMTSTDAVTWLTGVKKRSDAAVGTVLEMSSNWGATAGSFGVFTSVGAPQSVYGSRSAGTQWNSNANSASTYPAPHKALLSGVMRISTDTNLLRINGAQVAFSAGDQGAGNYGAHKFFLLRRAGTTNTFNGRLYGATVIGKLLTDGQLAAAGQAERQLGRLY